MINKAILMGRIGKKEYKQMKNGSFLCQLSIATNEKYLDSHNNKVELTTWHQVSCFNKLAEIANKYTHVGDLVHIEGKISHKKVIDANGVEKWMYSVIGNEITLIPTGRKDHPATLEPSDNAETPSQVCEMHDDPSIPF